MYASFSLYSLNWIQKAHMFTSSELHNPLGFSVRLALTSKSKLCYIRRSINQCENFAFVDIDALPDERSGLHSQLLVVLARAVFLGSESSGTHDYILLPQF
jgi:hypothetical protein